MTAEATALYDAWTAKFDAARGAHARLTPFPQREDFWGDMAAEWTPGGGFPGADPELLAMARPDEVWLDVGAGAGRIAAELAPRVREVVACDPSPGMTAKLKITAAGADGTITVLEPTPWPPTRPVPTGDVTLAVMVIFFVREIAPFIDAMEAHARQQCIVVATTHPGDKPHSFELWQDIHGEPFVALPAVGDFIAVLRARGSAPTVRSLGPTRQPVTAPLSVDEAMRRHRARYLVAEASEKDARMRDGLTRRYGNADGTVGPMAWDNETFIVSWPAA